MTDQDFWNSRYETGETGWDLNSVSPPLKSIIDSLLHKDMHILIPGCGNAWEAAYLIEKGFGNVTLIDIAPLVVERLKQKFAGLPVNIIEGDFFKHNGHYDLILEQTFFCALPPALRVSHVAKCADLLSKKGSIKGVLFNVTFEKEGPPFGGSQHEYEILFSPLFQINKMEPCTNSVEKRKSNELIFEMEKK